ncbi:glutathione peroxidase 7-like [Littorina saxatilis]
MDIKDNIVSLEKYRGKVSLVVNVASHCGYTDNHYKSLVRLQELLEDTKKFNVLAFPCNQFGKQEPGSNAEIFNFANEKYDVIFPMFAKVNVKGPNALDAWRYLNDKSGVEPDWNFWKYLVNHEGKLVKGWGPWMDPDKLFNIILQTIKKANTADSNSTDGKKSRADGEL